MRSLRIRYSSSSNSRWVSSTARSPRTTSWVSAFRDRSPTRRGADPRGERQVELTQREFELLEYLMRNERIVISRQRLLDEVWGYDPFSTTNTIEVFVSNLRRKLEAEGEPRLLHTIRGAGYVLRA